MKIHLFITCLNDCFFPKTGVAVVEVLERLGHEVVFDLKQTCCGQMHLNSGYNDEAKELLIRWLDVFEQAEYIVSPSGSCIANIKEMGINLARWKVDADLCQRLEQVSKKTFEFSEFLLKVLKIDDVGAEFPHRCTYHPTCHGARMLGLGDTPKKLLAKVKGLDLVELPDQTQCCGFGGTFSVKNADTSTAMLNDKCEAIGLTDAEYCIALDNSCLMHIGGGLRKSGSKAKVIHLAEVLASRGAK